MILPTEWVSKPYPEDGKIGAALFTGLYVRQNGARLDPTRLNFFFESEIREKYPGADIIGVFHPSDMDGWIVHFHHDSLNMVKDGKRIVVIVEFNAR